ncbi:sugar ABC transporter ATP-binding protein [Weizmannia coagulans]|uniref:ABC transporter related protein n=3 Tax=Heyndrickxia TaxID=2837504 RepID=G2TI30_HEYCO|nr:MULTISPECIES: sugar ABC transporter ATP-binding protein [Heyndrickxia]AEP00963.1 ABC transporter related protein [Heyndrickxia coagulans 36D1]AJO21400.1 ABC transporter-like protein [Heyndrickxia coagulans]AKN52973.1 Ribose ABC transport system, ATP-binding protein RbsA [Heyndrickxia coagulans]APB37331.1 D-xylose ABC transporter ATP-binding protein [Heyndrickxia coagulans]ATW81994.1 sugar ABC transporter ATP-binding protein [Heyndrickxia coagulans]
MQIEMHDIYKSFGANKVLEGVNFSLLPGEVHALMGENGAGKSTLMNILTGLHQKDKGKIIIDGKETLFQNPKEAEQAGIAFIHQELNIWPEMTVLENLFIGREITRPFGVLKTKEMKALAKGVFDRLNISLPFDRLAGACSVGEQQMIEIAKALLTDAEVMIMDEPTAALTDREIQSLFSVIESLKKNHVSIVYISHRMDEIFQISDRITVMRDGKTVDTKRTKDTGYQEVVKKMVGRDLEEQFPQRTARQGNTILEVRHFSSRQKFKDIHFSVRSGEILGVAGLMGAGRTEIMRALFGIDPYDAGEIFIEGKKVRIKNPSDAVQKGIAFITENRKDEGLILDFTIRDNIALSNLESFAPNGVIKAADEKSFVDMMIQRLQIKTSSSETVAGDLSGGNQQKVVLAKWVGTAPKVLILDEPTRGIDVGAKREIYYLMNELTERGMAIIMISSELPEILGMSDRVLVIHEGEIAGELDKAEATQENIMFLATGGKKHGTSN